MFGKPQVEKPVHVLIQEGIEAYDRGNYKLALDNFQQLKDWYPFSKFAILAELKIADAHYHLEEYPEAISAYEDFERFHPRNEVVPYVIYQIGRCYFEQIDSVDRDQTAAKNALEAFRRLDNQYPNDSHSRAARSHIIVCLQSLAGHDLYVGRYYLKTKQYEAAHKRFLSIVSKYPDVGLQQEALLYIAKCEAYLKKTEDFKESDIPDNPD